MTIRQFTESARNEIIPVCEDVREADNILSLLLQETLGLSRHHLKIQADERIKPQQLEKLADALERLKKNEPVQYVLGTADFFGMSLIVNRHTLIPRPETEELVDLVIKTLLPESLKRTIRVFDIGTGSGCIAIALKKHLPEAEVVAADISPEAIAVAEENARIQRAEVDFTVCDFLDENNHAELGRFDAIVSNPPYITRDEFSSLAVRVIDFEPQDALIARSNDPFIFYRRIATFGKHQLARGGMVFAEINQFHAEEIRDIFKTAGYRSVKTLKDLQENNRMLTALV